MVALPVQMLLLSHQLGCPSALVPFHIATIVNGTPWLIYPGVCQPHVDPGCSESGFSYAQAVPADLNDPYLRTWRKMPPIVNDTFGI